MANRVWTIDRLFRLVVQASDGVPFYQIKIDDLSQGSIRHALEYYNIKLTNKSKRRPKQLWTDSMIRDLQSYCELGFRSKIIASKMGLSPKQVKNAMSKHKISNGRSAKGCTPWNKGKRYSNPSSGNHLKGKPPHNLVENMTISKHKERNGFRWKIKVNGKWQSLPKYLWQQSGNSIPKGSIVRLRNPDDDPIIENVICVSRSENIRLNYRPKKVKSLRKPEKFYDPKKDLPWYLKTG